MVEKRHGLLNVKWICLVLMILAGILAVVGACADQSGSCGDGVNYTLDDNGTLTISGSGFMTSHPWGQGFYYFDSNDDDDILVPIKKVVINSGVKSICNYAFDDCNEITSVSIPEGMVRIGIGAFQSCSSIPSITLPNSVTSIGESAFYGCSSLTSFAIPNNVTKIENNTFSYCSALTSVTIPDDIVSLGDYAFSSCSKLATITIPCKIGQYTFGGCIHLTSVTFLEGATSMGPRAFSGCSDLQNLIIPNSLTEFGKDAFKDCWSLTNITIPATNKTAISWFKNNGYEKAIKIQPIQITDCTIESIPSQTYDGGAIEPRLEIEFNGDNLVNGHDYTLTYANNVNVGIATVTVTGIGDYTGTTTVIFEITCADIKNCYLKDYIPDQTYAAKPLTPKFTLIFKSNDAALTEGIDYTVTYTNNTKPGTANVTVNGIGNFTGIGTTSFDIVGGTIQLKKTMVTPIKDYTYTGKEIKPSVILTYEGSELTKDKDYTVTYSKNKDVGKATVTITGIGDYIGTVNTTFAINPKDVKLSSLKGDKGSLTVKWKKGTDIDGYEIEYSQKKDFKGSKKVTISKAKTTSTKIKKLVSGNTYYVRIRGFKKVGGKKYYSVWSKVLNAKVK